MNSLRAPQWEDRPKPARIHTERPQEQLLDSGLLPNSTCIRESRSDSGMRRSALSRQLGDINVDKARNVLPAEVKLVVRTEQSSLAAFQSGIPSPPSTPPSKPHAHFTSLAPRACREGAAFSVESRVNLEGCAELGAGLWSTVYRVEVESSTICAMDSPITTLPVILTPPTTPQRPNTAPTSTVFAVKSASRPDSLTVFEEEAHVLDYIQSRPHAASYVVPFHGVVNDGSALVFDCADTTLASYATTFVATPAITALLEGFPAVCSQLIQGLAFLHSNSVIHADIKPANILLNFNASSPIVRYADFSASIISESAPTTSSTSNLAFLAASPIFSAPVSRANSQRKPSSMLGGGTWTYMAPEQLHSNPATNEPSYASDVYSLGVTLLVVLLGGASPFFQIEGQNIFLLREAIKLGNPLSFAKNDPSLRKRVKALETDDRGRDALRLVGLALKKNKADRVLASQWE